MRRTFHYFTKGFAIIVAISIVCLFIIDNNFLITVSPVTMPAVLFTGQIPSTIGPRNTIGMVPVLLVPLELATYASKV